MAQAQIQNVQQLHEQYVSTKRHVEDKERQLFIDLLDHYNNARQQIANLKVDNSRLRLENAKLREQVNVSANVQHNSINCIEYMENVRNYLEKLRDTLLNSQNNADSAYREQLTKSDRYNKVLKIEIQNLKEKFSSRSALMSSRGSYSPCTPESKQDYNDSYDRSGVNRR